MGKEFETMTNTFEGQIQMWLTSIQLNIEEFLVNQSKWAKEKQVKEVAHFYTMLSSLCDVVDGRAFISGVDPRQLNLGDN